MRIGITNQSTLCSDADVAKWCDALTIQVKDCADHWGRRPVKVQFLGKTAPLGYDNIVVLDDPDQAGALGWHSSQTGSFPFGRVFARPAINNNVTVSSVLSHEVLELFVDPFVALWSSDMGSPGKLYALEVGDPVESDSYQINGVTVSNFALPAWFNAADQTGPWDKLGKTTGPFRMTPGGYVVISDEGGTRQVFGREYPAWRRETKKSPLARSYKRRDHHGSTAPPVWAKQIITAVRSLQKEVRQMADQQAHLDTDVAALTAGIQALGDAATAIEAEIAALKNQPQASSIDFSKLDARTSDLSAAVTRLRGDAPAPVTAPAPAPTTPPVGGRAK